MTRLRDALALHRLVRMKTRSARMQVMTKAAAGKPACDCPACSGIGRPLADLFRLLGAEAEPGDPKTTPRH